MTPESELRRLISHQESLEARLEDVRAALAAERGMRMHWESAAQDLRVRLKQLEAANAQGAAELALLRANSHTTELVRQVREEKQLRQDLERSYSWRATAPVRKILNWLHVRGRGDASSR